LRWAVVDHLLSIVYGQEGRVNRFMDSVFSLGPFLIPISAIVIGGIVVVVKMILSHQERIAKIERGIDPDVPRR
jgi:hypothetical protein